MKRTAYELLAQLDRNLRDSINLFKQIAECPGQRPDVLTPLSNEIQYVRAQAGFEVTAEASEFEQDQSTHWSRVRHKYEMWLKDPDDVFLDAEERDQQRKKLGLPPRIVVLPWSSEEEEKLMAAKRVEVAKKCKATRQRASSPKAIQEGKKK
ncbi:MAG TPA: hypothetical protein VN902_02815 [Candidatus Acidoferrales bacterium]|nr:hypothetical protein [Candidatus Acidoferrales bacterium]